MRRFIVVAGIFLSGLFLSACGTKTIESNRPILTFKSDIEISSEELNLTARIARTEEETQVEIMSPGSLCGLKISHGKSGNSIAKNDLEYRTDEMVLPTDSSVATIFEVLEYMAENGDEEPFYKDSEEMAFIGKVAAGKFELRSERKTGFIKEIKLGDKTTIKFSNQEKL